MSFALDIGMKRSVCVQVNSDQKTFAINTYVNLPEGALCRVSSKSIRLSIDNWRVFIQNLETIQNNFNKLKENVEDPTIDLDVDLGDMIHVCMVSNISCVHIRTYYHLKGKLLPGLPGIGLKLTEFSCLLEAISSINSAIKLDEQQ